MTVTEPEARPRGRGATVLVLPAAAAIHGGARAGASMAFGASPSAVFLPQTRGSSTASTANAAVTRAPPRPSVAIASNGGVTPRQNATAAALATGFAGTVLAASVAALRCRRRPRHGGRGAAIEVVARRMGTTEDWAQKVRKIEGERAVFDVTIPKPLGLTPANFPNRPGVGVAKIARDGNTDKHNENVCINDAEGMFVLEGDEVVAINGTTVEGESLDKVGPLVKDSQGDSVTLTLCRAWLAGPVKVIFLPSGKMATMKRGAEILQAASVGVEEVSYSCKEGWCKACWQTDPIWGTMYRACSAASKKRPPPKMPRCIPEKWDTVAPLYLMNRQLTMKKVKEGGLKLLKPPPEDS